MKTDPLAPETFVAAFANAIAGDVSGNVELGHIPNGTDDKQKMQKAWAASIRKGHGIIWFRVRSVVWK